MDLKVMFVIACLCALYVTSTEAGIPKCCIGTKNHIPKSMLRNIYRIEWQSSTGACDIDALILYVRKLQKPFCLNPKVLGWLSPKSKLSQTEP